MRFYKEQIDDLIDVNVNGEQLEELLFDGWLPLDPLPTFDSEHPFAGVWIFAGVCIAAAIIGWICQNVFNLW